VILVLAVAVPIAVYLLVFSDNPKFKPEVWTCNIKETYR
jgi:hypothetical protein